MMFKFVTSKIQLIIEFARDLLQVIQVFFCAQIFLLPRYIIIPFIINSHILVYIYKSRDYIQINKYLIIISVQMAEKSIRSQVKTNQIKPKEYQLSNYQICKECIRKSGTNSANYLKNITKIYEESTMYDQIDYQSKIFRSIKQQCVYLDNSFRGIFHRFFQDVMQIQNSQNTKKGRSNSQEQDANIVMANLKIEFESLENKIYESLEHLSKQHQERVISVVKKLSHQIFIMELLLKHQTTLNQENDINEKQVEIQNNKKYHKQMEQFQQRQKRLKQQILGLQNYVSILTRENQQYQKTIRNMKIMDTNKKESLKKEINQLQNEIARLIRQNQQSYVMIGQVTQKIEFLESIVHKIAKENEQLKSCIDPTNLSALANIKQTHFLQTKIFPASELIKNLDMRKILFTFFQKKVYSTKLIYRASERRFKQFHSLCDSKSNVIVIALAQNQTIFGGFTPIPFNPACKNLIDMNLQSFLFAFPNNQNSSYKLKIQEGKCPIIHDTAYGPIFGQSEIRIQGRKCFSNYGILPGRYFRDPKIQNHKTFFGGNQQFKVKEYEVYQITFA